jgi:glycosyltransferase involved in cell wall biosynthesis
MEIESNPKLAYIATSYVENHDGISIYIENILRELSNKPSISIDIYVKKAVLKKLKSRTKIDNNFPNIKFIPVSDLNLLSIITLNYFINSKRYGLVFSPCLTLVFSVKNKSMKVIHDVTYKVYSKSMGTLKIFYKSFLFWLLNFDNYYGYISTATLKQIEKYTKLSKSKKPMIFLSNGIPFTAKDFLQTFSDNDERKLYNNNLNFLFVGSLNYHKGLDVAINFVKLVSTQTKKKIVLNVVGKKTKDTYEILNFNKENIDFEINIKGYISDSELYRIYSESNYMLCFSRSEGFGLPVVEAASFKVFPLLSDLPVFREITDNSLFYFSHEKNNLDDFCENFFNIEGNFSENQYSKILSNMVSEYSKKYNESANKIFAMLKSPR